MSERHIYPWPVTLKNRSRSVMVEDAEGFMGLHLWANFEESEPKSRWVILRQGNVVTEGGKFYFIKPLCLPIIFYQRVTQVR